MNPNAEQHLTYDELIRHLIDGPDPASSRQSHLESCHQCRREAEHLARRYQRLGQMARDLAPKPAHTFRLPEGGRTTHRRWQFRSALAMAVAAALILAFTLMRPSLFQHPKSVPKTATNKVVDDNHLMAQVDDLVADAMPKPYQKLVAVSEPVLTQDLIDWIVPSIDENNDKDLKPHA